MLFRFSAACLILLAAFAARAQDLDLVNVTLVDGTGRSPRPGVTVSIRGGKISAH